MHATASTQSSPLTSARHVENTNSSGAGNLEPRAQFIAYLTETGTFSEQQATHLFDSLSAEQQTRVLSLFKDESTMNPEKASLIWGLSAQESQALFSSQTGVALRSNPFGIAFLRFMQLAYELQIDLKGLLHMMLGRQVSLAIEAAEERFKGAIVQFALAMAAAFASGLCGAMSVYKAKQMGSSQAPKNKDAEKSKDGDETNPNAPPNTRDATDNQWFSPIGASLITQPLNAAGEFGNQYYQLEGATLQAYADEAGKLYEQLLSMYQTERESDRTMANGA